jgi:hypothetical protein
VQVALGDRNTRMGKSGTHQMNFGSTIHCVRSMRHGGTSAATLCAGCETVWRFENERGVTVGIERLHRSEAEGE